MYGVQKRVKAYMGGRVRGGNISSCKRVSDKVVERATFQSAIDNHNEYFS